MTVARFPSLPELQMLMSELIRAPEGVARGVRALVDRGDLETDDLSFAIEANERMSSQERLDVYASMYFFRLHDCLAEDFPKTRARLGDGHFNNLITDYLLAHPPSHYSLREAGRALPPFLSDHPLNATFPFAGDTARLEWARVDVFDDWDATPLGREELLEASARDPEAFSIRWIPAARMLSIDFRALRHWSDPEGETPISDRAAGPVDVVVWRKGFRVFHRLAEEDEARCFEALSREGLTLADLAEHLLKPDASAERTSERFAGLLERWLHDELLVDGRGS